MFLKTIKAVIGGGVEAVYFLFELLKVKQCKIFREWRSEKFNVL